MNRLTRFNLVYLASPYSKYKDGLNNAFVEISKTAAALMKDGVKVYSPIAHTHPLAIYGNVDPYDYDIWLPFDAAIMNVSDALVVCEMDGWDTSFGVKHEIDTFIVAQKPIFYLNPVTMEVTT
jgi:hypothetical protein